MNTGTSTQATVATHKPRSYITEDYQRGRPKQQKRLAVEEALRTCERIVTGAELAKLAGVPARVGQRIASVLVERGTANYFPPVAGRSGRYQWITDEHRAAMAAAAARVDEEARQAMQQAEASKSRSYDGRELRPYAGRPGAMDAYALPSLDNGRRTPHRPPISLASTPLGPAHG